MHEPTYLRWIESSPPLAEDFLAALSGVEFDDKPPVTSLRGGLFFEFAAAGAGEDSKGSDLGTPKPERSDLPIWLFMFSFVSGLQESIRRWALKMRFVVS
jgi:hypothetical protein